MREASPQFEALTPTPPELLGEAVLKLTSVKNTGAPVPILVEVTAEDLLQQKAADLHSQRVAVIESLELPIKTADVNEFTPSSRIRFNTQPGMVIHTLTEGACNGYFLKDTGRDLEYEKMGWDLALQDRAWSVEALWLRGLVNPQLLDPNGFSAKLTPGDSVIFPVGYVARQGHLPGFWYDFAGKTALYRSITRVYNFTD